MSNVVTVTLKAPSGGSIICMSNAAFYQRVTISLPDDTLVFKGSGEQVMMTMPDGKTNYIIGKFGTDISVTLTFEYSQQGSEGPFYPVNQTRASQNDGPIHFVYLISTEDATDNDFNDTFVSINYLTKTATTETSGSGIEGASF